MKLQSITAALILVVLWILPLKAFSREIREIYNGVRPLGMGNAFVAISDDYNALLYNPAGLELLKDGTFSFFIRAEGSASTKDIIDSVDSSQSSSEIESQLNELVGKKGSLGTDINIAYVKNGFGLAFMPVNLQFSYDIQKAGVLPTVDVRAVVDTHIITAFTKNFFKKRLMVGLSPRFTYRASYEEAVTPIGIESGALKLKNFNEGWGIDANLGFIYRPPWYEREIKPTIGLVIKNIMETQYHNTYNLLHDDTKRPEENKRKLDVGFAITPLESWGPFSMTFALDIKNIGDRYQKERNTKYIHYGTELKSQLTNWLGGAFRVGMNQTKLWTAGASWYMSAFNLDIASYAEELGGYPGQKPDRRFTAQAGLVF